MKRIIVKKNRSIKKPIKSKEIFIWPVQGSIITYFGKQKGGRKNDGINIKDGKAFNNSKGNDYCFTARKLMSFFGDYITVQEI